MEISFNPVCRFSVTKSTFTIGQCDRVVLLLMFTMCRTAEALTARLSAPSCHLLGKINARATFFSTRHL